MKGPKAQSRERWEIPLLALILTAAAAFRLAELDGLPPFIDETAGLVLSVDYQSWDVWSRLLHGKLLGYLWFKPIFLLAWDPLYAGRLFSALAGVLSVVLTYGLLLGQFTRKAALAGTAFIALMPLLVFHDRLALFDGFLVAGLAGALLLYLRPTEDHPLTLLLAGFLLGVVVLTKGYALLGILACFPVLRRRPGSHSRAVMTAVVGLLACILAMTLFLGAQLKGGLNFEGALNAPQQFLAPDLTASQRLTLGFQQLGQILGYLHGYNGWVFLPAVVLAALGPGSRRRLRLELLATWLLSCVILAFAFRFLFSRYLLVTLPALGILVAVAFDDYFEKRRSDWKTRVFPLTSLLLFAACAAVFVYSDALIATQSLRRVLPPRDAYQYLWGAPSGFGLREIAAQLRGLDLLGDRKVICVTRGMGTGTHGAATLPILLRHSPVRFVHVWLESDQDLEMIRRLPAEARVVFFVDDPGFLSDQVMTRLGARSKLLFEVKGTTGRPNYRLIELVR